MVLSQKWSRVEVGRKDDSELNVGKKDVAREKKHMNPQGKQSGQNYLFSLNSRHLLRMYLFWTSIREFSKPPTDEPVGLQQGKNTYIFYEITSLRNERSLCVYLSQHSEISYPHLLQMVSCYGVILWSMCGQLRVLKFHICPTLSMPKAKSSHSKDLESVSGISNFY